MSPFHLGMGILAALALGAWLGVLGTLSWLRRNRWQRAPGVLDLVRSRGDRLELDALDAGIAELYRDRVEAAIDGDEQVSATNWREAMGWGRP